MVLFPHLTAGLRPAPARSVWACRPSTFLVLPSLVLLGLIGFVSFGGVGDGGVVSSAYRPAFDFAALIGSGSTTAPPAPAPTFSDPHAPVNTSPEKDHRSAFSFDIGGHHGGKDGGENDSPLTDWMARVPDNQSLAHMSIPGTHDTMTHRIDLLGYRCQNADLRTQLHGGVRYLDIRARVQVDISKTKNALGIYHGRAYTGYGLGDVVQTVAEFLAAHPSEAVIMRVKEEGMPLAGAPDDAPGLAPNGGAPVDVPSRSGSPFLDAFEAYLGEASLLAGLLFKDTPDGIPPLGKLRGKVLLLQEFPYFPADRNYTTPGVPLWGIPWQLASDRLAVEDYWQMRSLADLDAKWDAVRANLQAAARQAAFPESAVPPKLYLSHLSASVGVTPIDAAAGPTNHSVVGINDRTGAFVERGRDLYNEDRPGIYTPIGVVMADFPGTRLMEAIVKRNGRVAD